jgi:hypothetical protein
MLGKISLNLLLISAGLVTALSLSLKYPDLLRSCSLDAMSFPGLSHSKNQEILGNF